MTQNQKIVTLVCGLVIIVAGFVLFSGPKPEYGNATVGFKKTGELIQAYVPMNDAASKKGLGGRTVLPEDYGMLWQFKEPTRPSFTMEGMRFPLDFLWMRDGQVVEIRAFVPVSTGLVMPSTDITSVLEVSGGYAERHSVRVGDSAEIMGSSWSGQ